MRKVIVTTVDDLDPTGKTLADETVTFGLDGTQYEIDLSAENAHVLRARLKQFIQAGRPLSRAASKTRRPMTTDAGDGATFSRHQGGTDPAEARAWAIKHGLIPEGQRGRLSAKYKDAFRAFERGDRGPLDKLLEIPHQSEEGDPDWNPDGNEPKQSDRSKVSAPVNAVEEEETRESEAADEDPAEAEALMHYQPITRSARMADDNKWERRTGYGNPRTEKIAEWKLTERIAALSTQHLGILGMLAGAIPLAKGDKVSYLKTSDVRLENMEFIQEDKNSPHGWGITDFGRHAYKVRTSGV
ncbi:histone-like nucleoid-structuring protein Lsr2 [Streptomyces kronopolitis]